MKKNWAIKMGLITWLVALANVVIFMFLIGPYPILSAHFVGPVVWGVCIGVTCRLGKNSFYISVGIVQCTPHGRKK